VDAAPEPDLELRVGAVEPDLVWAFEHRLVAVGCAPQQRDHGPLVLHELGGEELSMDRVGRRVRTGEDVRCFALRSEVEESDRPVVLTEERVAEVAREIVYSRHGFGDELQVLTKNASVPGTCQTGASCRSRA
jgi:hypothetical protein